MASLASSIALVESLDAQAVSACFSDYPDSWGISASLVESVTNYVLERRKHLRRVLMENFSS